MNREVMQMMTEIQDLQEKASNRSINSHMLDAVMQLDSEQDKEEATAILKDIFSVRQEALEASHIVAGQEDPLRELKHMKNTLEYVHADRNTSSIRETEERVFLFQRESFRDIIEDIDSVSTEKPTSINEFIKNMQKATSTFSLLQEIRFLRTKEAKEAIEKSDNTLAISLLKTIKNQIGKEIEVAKKMKQNIDIFSFRGEGENSLTEKEVNAQKFSQESSIQKFEEAMNDAQNKITDVLVVVEPLSQAA